MSILDYEGSGRIAAEVTSLTTGDEFYSLLMAAIRFADTDNLTKLVQAFPEVVDELRLRYNAPGGALTSAEIEYQEREP